jgi:CO dehydrogenase maturation factor
MKIAVSGKGGVGKTTITALLAFAFDELGRNVFAVDVDPTPCLSDSLCVPVDLRKTLVPIVEMEDLIYERTGAMPGTTGGFFTINPKVDDIPDRFSIKHKGIKILELGAVETGGSGCICPESAMLKTLFTHLLFRDEDVLLMDMYAGVEHISRATVDFIDLMLIVTEPSRRSIDAAKQMKKLSEGIGISNIACVVNKAKNKEDLKFVESELSEIKVIGHFMRSDVADQADREYIPLFEFSEEYRKTALELAKKLSNLVKNKGLLCQ